MLIDSEPDNVLLGLGVRLGRILSEAIERYQTTVFRLLGRDPRRHARRLARLEKLAEFWGRVIMPKQPHLQPKGRYAADRRR